MMPGFGKSGTVRIIFFRLSTDNSPHSIFNIEALVAPAQFQIGFIYRRDLRVRRPAPKLCAKLSDRFRSAFGDGFDGAVGQVFDAADNAETIRGADGEEAITDALHSALDDESPRDLHSDPAFRAKTQSNTTACLL